MSLRNRVQPKKLPERLREVKSHRRASSGNGKKHAANTDNSELARLQKFGTYSLTGKQYSFVMEYVLDPSNASRAAVRAGYAASNAAEASRRLLAKPEVQDAIDDLRTRLRDNTEITMERIVNELAGIAFAEATSNPRTADKIRSLELLSKWLGFDTSDFNGRVELVIRYEDERQQIHAGDVIDVNALPMDTEVIDYD